jgi:recombination DNA repair RAD52 pathway protein
VDYFTRDELKKAVRDFKDHMNTAEDDGITSRNSLLDTSTAKLFDEMMNRRRSSTAMKRRQTLIAQETVLNENSGTSCLVSQVTQYITSTIAGYVREQSQMITIDTFPMKWRVKRLDSDF